ncbi:MAG: colanic acid biosynthesis glycosyltransferase WcaI [Chitinophagaceae bacterium]|nr:MAG: colanic acid biosynthesis glycosyltransferase WcaI [Chitinophagaceae bacterium]
MNPKRVLLIGGNFSPELTGIGKYNGEMASWFAKEGIHCTVITTFPYYPEWKVDAGYRKQSWFYRTERNNLAGKGSVHVYRCPHYVPKKPSGLKRMISDLTFFMSAFVQVFFSFFHKKYDVVIAVAPPFHVGFLALFYKWITRTPMVYHIQDLQIDAAKELGMIRQKGLLNLMFRLEAFILKRTDWVSSISYGMIRRIGSKTEKEVVFFPNWVDMSGLYPLFDQTGLKSKFGFREEEKLVLYSGAIGEKQGLENILLAAMEMKDENIRFAVCGSGPYKEKLRVMAEEGGLTNVSFLPLQPKESFNDFLNAADLHLVLQKANANDLVMPSKLTGILAVGGSALVTAPEGSSLYNYISGHEIATLAEPENLVSLVAGIRIALADHNVKEIRSNAYSFANEYLNIEKVMPKFLADLVPAGTQDVAKPSVKVTRQPVQDVNRKEAFEKPLRA